MPGLPNRSTAASWASAVLASALLCTASLSAQTSALQGVVRDSISRAPLANAEVRLLDNSGETVSSTLSLNTGTFTLAAAPASYTLVVTRVGYREQRVEGVRVGQGAEGLEVLLLSTALLIDPVTVTVGRFEQTAMDAPSAMSVVGRERIWQEPSLTATDVVRQMPGVNTNTLGLGLYSYNTRGAAGTGFGGARTLVDFRYATMPSTSRTEPGLAPVSSLDVERVELIRGPASALHGPGASQGLIHVISRSAFDEGTTVALAAGSSSLIQPAFRHAQALSDQFAFKVTGEYFRGDNWEYTDPVEAALRAAAIEQGADPDTLLIGLRDSNVESFRGTAAIEWRPNERTSLVASAGQGQTVDATTMAEGIGGLQLRNWSLTYGHVRLNSGQLFANVFYAKNESGDSYVVRSGALNVDRSWNAVAQLQHGLSLGEATHLRYGADLNHTAPNTGGTYHGRYESLDNHDRYGAFVNATHALTPTLDVYGAFRVDTHSSLDGNAYTPMAAVVFRPRPEHSFRAAVERAFDEPLSVLLFPDVIVQSFGPYNVRFTAVPHDDGFRFRRDCGGLCMRSPFNARGPEQFLATDATLVWDGLVQAMLAAGVDLTAIPAPAASDVQSVLSAPPSTVVDLPPLRHNYFNSVEVGYKGFLADRLYVTVDVSRTSEEGAGQLRVITPTVTLEEASLAQYLGRFMPQADADAVAAGMSTIPGGVVTPENALDPYDIIAAEASVDGSLVRWRAEVSAEVEVTEGWTVGGSYSWVDNDSIPDFGGSMDLLLNHSKSLGSFRVGYDGPELSGQIQGRAVRSFPFNSGVYAGRVPGYTTVDATVEWRVPWQPGLSISLSGTNILDNQHIELIGAPEIGRMIMTRLRMEF